MFLFVFSVLFEVFSSKFSIVLEQCVLSESRVWKLLPAGSFGCFCSRFTQGSLKILHQHVAKQAEVAVEPSPACAQKRRKLFMNCTAGCVKLWRIKGLEQNDSQELRACSHEGLL